MRRTRAAGWVWAACCVLAAGSPAGGADGDAAVLVNGQPISRERIAELALEAHGLEAMQQLILLELARQEAARLGIRIAPADVQAEFDRALERIGGPEADATLTRQQRLEALDVVLQQNHLSMAEYMITMERNACLRRIVERDLKFDEATLREEFARTFGERVVVRHIQLDDHADVNEVLDKLRQGVDFAELARRYSRNPQTAVRGGEMDPFAFSDDRIPPALREAAFSMKPGEVSGAIRLERYYHILRLEKRIPPQDVRFEDVRDQVERRMRQRVGQERMNQLATRLFEQAQVKVIDPRLKERYDELLRRNRQERRAPAP